ncbi:MAG: hypothetical protein AAF789_08690 [Bacteroidota bacterium]
MRSFLFAGILVLTSCASDDLEPDLGDGIEIDLSLAPFQDLKRPNTWVLHPSINLMLCNDGDVINGFSSVSPHSRCTRDWVFGPTEATCTCQGSVFGLQGQVLRGPATENLTSFEVSRTGDILTVR